MNIKQYKCLTCKSADIPPQMVKDVGFNVCPICGNLYPITIEYITNYFRIIALKKELYKAKDLLLKAEMDAAVREAIITFETVVKKKSGLDELLGANLMAEAFNFKIDQKTKVIIEAPKIAVNDLSSLSKRNEQEGIKLMTMGFMQGIRNVYMHTKGAERLYYALLLISMVDLFLKQVDGRESIATCSDKK